MEKEFPFDHELKKEILSFPIGEPPKEADLLEIGPGRGDFLLSAAQAEPAKLFVAVENKKRRFFKIADRLKKGAVANATLLLGDARIVLPLFFSEGSFQNITCLFPDPWPKDRHSFHRLLNLRFLWLIAFLLKKRGSFIFATDDKDYADSVADDASRISWWRRQEISDDKIRALFPETFFEQKWRSLGRKIFLFEFKKIS